MRQDQTAADDNKKLDRQMKFALCYYYDPTQTAPSQAEIPGWMAFDQAGKDAGVFLYEAGFPPVDAAQTVHVCDGEVTVESKGAASPGNALAGFYVLEVADRQATLSGAQQIPTAHYGQVEVREIVEF